MNIFTTIRNALNALRNRDPTFRGTAYSYSSRPDRVHFTRGNERSIITAVYNRIATDVASVNIEHAMLDDNNRYLSSVESGLNNCLNLEANIDQTSRAFIQDIVMSVFDEGCVAIVPVDYKTSDDRFDQYTDILTMRTAKITQWFPHDVQVYVWNENTGTKEYLTLPKKMVAIIENPFYAVINEPSSTMGRLIRKLCLLDSIDEQNSSGKLDLIIQLPYVIKSKAKQEQAEARRKDIEMQLSGSKYGIAYTDGTERITQLNRPVENNMLAQVEYLTNMLYSQLGITQSILDGTAPESVMLNYYNRTIEPIVDAIVQELRRKFLTKEARSRKEDIVFFRDAFKLAPLSQIATIGSEFVKQEVATPNEIRQVIGWRPSKDPKADELHNSSLAKSTEEVLAEQKKQGDNVT